MLEIDNLDATPNTMRIAFVTETWPPEINGVAITLHRLAVALQERGHAIQVVRPRQSSSAELGQSPAQSAGQSVNFEETLTHGVPIPNYPQLRLGLPAKGRLVRLWTLRRPDLVHIATEGPLGWSAIKAARKLKIPVSSDFRTNFQSYGKHYGIIRLQRAIALYLRKFHNQTDFTTVPTQALRQELQACGFQRLEVIARGVDTHRFHPNKRDQALRSRWGAGPDTRVYLYVGRLAAEKNPSLLFRAWQVIRAQDPRAILVVVGDGPAQAVFKGLMPDGIYTGAKRDDELAVHFASGDMLLFPSMTETYGNVLGEAMASGLATLTFDYAASSELITHPENGWVARFGEDSQYLEMAAELGVLPDAKLMAIREQARKTMLNHGWDVITEKMENLWRNLLAVR